MRTFRVNYRHVTVEYVQNQTIPAIRSRVVAIRVSLALVQSSAAAARYDFVLFQKKNYVCKPSKCMSPQFEKDYSPNKLHNLQKK